MKKYSRIILIGFMGCGKTYFAQKLSQELQLEFIDLDIEIQKTEKISIKDIFKVNGEKYFRQIESKTLREVKDNCVIAAGGGIIEKKENRDFLKNKLNFVIWINSDWDIIYNRIKNSHRPLVVKFNEKQLLELWQSRTKFYRECADITVSETDKQNIRELLTNYGFTFDLIN